jgi:membrane-associated protease RseP (regulator of RpoE activity)
MNCNRFFAIGLLALATPLVAPAQEPADDTKAIVALGELGAQMQIEEGRILVVNLTGEKIDDSAVKLLASAVKLQTIVLAQTKVTGEGLAALKNLPALRELIVQDTPLVDRDVPHLAELKSVQLYRLHGTEISGMGRQRLKVLLDKAKREATIDFHRGGFLGVGGNLMAENCMITQVMPDSAASAGGIEVGDVVVKLDGKPISDFPSLSQIVSDTPPGDMLTITLLRGGETLTKKVTLRRRGPMFVPMFPPP